MSARRRARLIRTLALTLGLSLMVAGTIGGTASAALVDGWTVVTVLGAVVLIATVWILEGGRR